MPKQRFGLGRGLDALIPSGSSPANSVPAMPARTETPGRPTIPLAEEMLLDTSLSPSNVFEVPCTAIAPNPHQPRAAAGDDDPQLLELAASIRAYGLLQPLLVTIAGETPEGEPIYQLIAGERRLRAAQLAGWVQVPVIVREATPQQMLEMALIENLQRTDLNPLEEAHGFLLLQEEYHLTQDQIAARVGKDRSTVANKVRLLQLPREVREYLLTMPQVFTEGHARAILQVPGDDARIALANLVIAKGMTVRETEDRARQYAEAAIRLTPDRRGSAARASSYEIRALEEEFTRAIEMKVRLMRNAKGKGSLTLYFTNEQQLQELYNRLVAAQRGPGSFGGFANGGFAGEGDATSALLDDTFENPYDDEPSGVDS